MCVTLKQSLSENRSFSWPHGAPATAEVAKLQSELLARSESKRVVRLTLSIDRGSRKPAVPSLDADFPP